MSFVWTDLCVVYVYYRIVRKRRPRKWDVHPVNCARHVDGAYRNLFGLLREDNEKFFNYLRMSLTSFDELVVKYQSTFGKRQDLVQGIAFSTQGMLAITQSEHAYPECASTYLVIPYLKQTSEPHNKNMCARAHLLVCVRVHEHVIIPITVFYSMTILFVYRYLGSGCTYTDLHYAFRLGITTASKVVPNTCVLWIALKSIVFPQFNKEYWRVVAEGFKKRAHFPHCLRAVDGKTHAFINPEHSESLYHNYKHFFSVVLLTVADSNYRFLYVDVGSVGKAADQTILYDSTFGRALADGSLEIPQPDTVSPELSQLDAAVPTDTLNKEIFNYRLSTARRYVECTFGILTYKWRISHRSVCLNHDNSVCVIKAACSLYNVREEENRTTTARGHTGMSLPRTSPAVKSLCHGKTAGYEHSFLVRRPCFKCHKLNGFTDKHVLQQQQWSHTEHASTTYHAGRGKATQQETRLAALRTTHQVIRLHKNDPLYAMFFRKRTLGEEGRGLARNRREDTGPSEKVNSQSKINRSGRYRKHRRRMGADKRLCALAVFAKLPWLPGCSRVLLIPQHLVVGIFRVTLLQSGSRDPEDAYCEVRRNVGSRNQSMCTYFYNARWRVVRSARLGRMILLRLAIAFRSTEHWRHSNKFRRFFGLYCPSLHGAAPAGNFYNAIMSVHKPLGFPDYLRAFDTLPCLTRSTNL
ncbi:hypothetical protein PR048_021184 [Dryococelus australis]|uniref:DDE Tnp4 domain-containing protein n=1 Tax=Dryococelus australis TaxID=614101 RepID=A0ABQ9GXI4_9NEOP|nr:hypothetical protein PR048_021184 [Dryococelus australis]